MKKVPPLPSLSPLSALTQTGDEQLIEEFFDTLEASWGDFTGPSPPPFVRVIRSLICSLELPIDSFHALTLHVNELDSLLALSEDGLREDGIAILLQKTIHRLVPPSPPPLRTLLNLLTSLAGDSIHVPRGHCHGSLSEIKDLASAPPADGAAAKPSRPSPQRPRGGREPFPPSLPSPHLSPIPPQAAKRFVGAPLSLLKDEIAEKIDTSLLVSKTRSLGQGFHSLSPEEKRSADTERWERWLRKYQRRIQSEALSLTEEERLSRAEQMRKANPTFVLRNWIAFEVTEAAERSDYSKVDLVLRMLQDPYRAELSVFSESPPTEFADFIRPAPDWAPSFTCTCSS
jgi:hypothetical protein